MALIAIASSARAQTILYSDNFDVDSTANWTVNSFVGGTTSSGGNAANAYNFFFDYSTIGIPAAPNSTGGTTRGLKLQANVTGTGPVSTSSLPGISVSPNLQSFTGDYRLQFDWWTNFIGGTSAAGIGSGGSGSTQLSTFGILTSGTVANYAGSCDGVFYAATADGGSAVDYRAYSVTAASGYSTGTAGVNWQNVFAAGSQANTAALYTTLFPAGQTAPLIQQTTYPTTQTGSTVAGVPAFRWNDVIIEKIGPTITWTVNGTLLATTSTTGFATATKGNNILFGQADTNNTAGTPAATFQAVDFTLIDNVRVISVPEPSSTALVLAGLAGGGLEWRRRRFRKRCAGG